MAKWSVELFGHHKPRFELREVAFSDHTPVVAHGYHGEPYYYDIESYSEPGRGYAGTGYHKMTTDIKRGGTVKIQKKISQHVEMPVGFDDKKHFVYNVVGWEKRAEPSDIIVSKPDTFWNVSSDAEFREIQGKIKDPVWIMERKLEIYELYRLTSLRTATETPELFVQNRERIWQDILVRGIRSPKLLPAELSSKFVHAPGASLYCRYGKDSWTETEKKLFLIITLDNLEESQANALCESLWDTDSYKISTEFPKEPEELYPTIHLKKRRFHIPMNDLKSLGVDEGEMLCPNCIYVPEIRDIQKLECFDKLNSRYVLGTDGLNTISPIIYGGKV